MKTTEIKTKINTIGKQVMTLVRSASKLTIKKEADLIEATNILKLIKNKKTEIEEARQSWVDPLNQQVKRLNEIFRQAMVPLQEADTELRQAVLSYRQVLEARETARQVEAQKKAISVAKRANTDVGEVTPVEIAKSVNTGMGQITVSKVWDFEILDLSKVPSQYIQIDVPVVRQAIQDGKREIPGLKIFQKEILSVK
jgi:hypothetical protein